MVLLGKFAQDCEGRGSLYQKTKFRYGLYEFALLRYLELICLLISGQIIFDSNYRVFDCPSQGT